MVERTGLSSEAFDCLWSVSFPAVTSPGIDRAAGQSGARRKCRMLSHDDESPEMRKAFGARRRIAEFPVNEETAREAPGPVISSCSARPMSCAAAAIPDGPRPLT